MIHFAAAKFNGARNLEFDRLQKKMSGFLEKKSFNREKYASKNSTER